MGRHNFREDLPKGHGGEKVFHKMNSDLLIRTDGKEGDFIFVPDNKILELKSELSYSTTNPFSLPALEFRKALRIPPPSSPKGWRQTDNLFVERYSSEAAMSPGGPWQAQGHSAEYYVHFFPGDGAVFAYRTDEMVDFMEKNIDKRGYEPFPVWNPGYTTIGFRVPRVDVAHLEIRDMFPAWEPTVVAG